MQQWCSGGEEGTHPQPRNHMRACAHTHTGHLHGFAHISQCSMYQPERSIFGAGPPL